MGDSFTQIKLQRCAKLMDEFMLSVQCELLTFVLYLNKCVTSSENTYLTYVIFHFSKGSGTHETHTYAIDALNRLIN